MAFRLFGIPVEVQVTFLVGALLLGWVRGYQSPVQLAIWSGVVFLSVLIHELGHAAAFWYYRIRSEIVLHWLGGVTKPQALLPLSRPAHVLISVAGPGAGFIFAGVIFLVRLGLSVSVRRLPEPARFAMDNLLWVNIGWGIFNLCPVLPLDGGHALYAIFGPRHVRVATVVSMAFCGLGVFYAVKFGDWFVGFICLNGLFQGLRALQPADGVTELEAPRAPARPREAAVPGPIAARLRAAQRALEDEDFDKAANGAIELMNLAELDRSLPQRVSREALEILAWVRHLRGDTAGAENLVERARRFGDVDAALVGALKIAAGDTRAARRVLEEARAAGDDRKEIVGPLIQLLIADGEIPRAAAVALDIVDSLSDEDARQMARIAFDGRAYEWSARLSEAVWSRTGEADDAYEAARALAKDGSVDRAAELLERAVKAGFRDADRAWSDAALEPLRAAQKLDGLLPRAAAQGAQSSQ